MGFSTRSHARVTVSSDYSRCNKCEGYWTEEYQFTTLSPVTCVCVCGPGGGACNVILSLGS